MPQRTNQGVVLLEEFKYVEVIELHIWIVTICTPMYIVPEQRISMIIIMFVLTHHVGYILQWDQVKCVLVLTNIALLNMDYVIN